MFIEPNATCTNKGWIEVVTGSMFSGKTEELIRRLKRAEIARLNVKVFKPAIDTRYSKTKVMSHDSNALSSVVVKNSKEILKLSKGADIVGIDEAQFFDKGIVDVCEELSLRGIRVVAAGLDMDYLGKPFGQMPALLAVADYITKLHAICVVCGGIASISHRKTADGGQVLVGAKNLYEARCKECSKYDLKKKTISTPRGLSHRGARVAH